VWLAIGVSTLVLAAGWAVGVCHQREFSAGGPGQPPVLDALPLDPAPSPEFSDVEVVARLMRSVDRLEDAQAELDPFLGVDADADARRVQRLAELVPMLRVLAARLQQENDAGAVPPQSSSVASRPLARRLLLTSERLDLLLAQWSRCAPNRLSLLLAALESLSLELRSDAVLETVPTTAISYSFFPGHPPGVVPGEAAWLVAVRSEPWPRGTLQVALRARSRRDPVAISVAKRAGHANALAVPLDRERVAEFAGDCLRVEIRTGRGSEEKDGRQPPRDLLASWPLCIPYAMDTEYELVGYLDYRTPTRARTVERKEIWVTNSSCDQEKLVAEALEWELFPGGTLIDIGGSDLLEVNTTSIDCEIDGSRVRCTGTLAPATCEASEEGPSQLLQKTEWAQFFAPTEEIPEEEEHSSQAVSGTLSAEAAPEPFCVQLVRDEPSVESEMRFDLVVRNAHQRQVVFSSPPETLERELTTQYRIASRRIDARFEADGEPGSSHICVVLHADEVCEL
jgi:hypothetical protein